MCILFFTVAQTDSATTMEDCKVLTCLTCRVAFADIDKGRDHYKSEWHRYNLKRKVAQMAPLSAEVYKNQVAATKQEVILGLQMF